MPCSDLRLEDSLALCLCNWELRKGGVPLLVHPHYPTERSDEPREERSGSRARSLEGLG